MLGFLLARMGIDVFVLEKHADFLRDFRGDTIHPSTLEIMHELGILDEFLKRPHQQIRELAGQVGQDIVTIADFTHLPTHCRFLAFMPQWDFLDFITEQARRYPTFHLKMQAEVTDLIEQKGAVAGVHIKTPDGLQQIRAHLTIGADGRHSVVRERAGLEVMHLGAPMDVMWMRISRRPTDPGQTFGHIDSGKILVLLNREDYWQCAFVIAKGTAEAIKRRGLESFREEIAALAPFLRDRVGELQDWEQISLLTVAVDRLSRWSRPGLLCIGGAAHAYRRSGNQSRDSGLGCNGEYTWPKTFAKNSLRRRALRRPATEEFPDSGHAATSNPCSEQRDPAGPWQPKTVDPSVASEASPPLANSAARSCPRNWDRLPSRAREDSRRSNSG
jgi:2-polyprenyl-6-methoxyphenol hydroxylase-like FAD-dependent oxidoreductase